MMNPQIVVVGSCMTDLTSYTEKLPELGETVHGESFTIGFGGKGANQCIAASRLGVQTAMVARVGSDSFGKNYIENFESSNVNRKHVHVTDGISTGIATIIVDGKGENSIIIVGGANQKMMPEDVCDAEYLIRDSQIVLCQGEINEAATIQALKLARKHKVRTLMNAAPASSDMDEEIYSLSDIFCVNETEAGILTGQTVKSLHEAEDSCEALMKRGCGEVILTMGNQGVVFATSTGVEHIPSYKVDTVVDTTGAGDSFIGALAFFLVSRPDLSRTQMLDKACQIAAISIQAKGTQTSFPYKDDLQHVL